ncbi:hypothetical protein ACFFQW_04980 [Umezawaea endophytica]|uniref:LPXTG-motif cell wall-anchored protein n=1 Tax=Umezawaea endophytica TaxID=1654476 RepID=A0A9X2VGL8_9PSEU|nr:hypothetical protein [Umezawaea endophytica]MCS7476275.1 hypothetical protein [Umezawaea endophytica]MCS7476276.1 hypothetical protein [Umezawaea endophytica]
MRTTSETVRHLVRAAGAFALAASTVLVLAGGAPAAAKGGETYGDNNATTCPQAQRTGDTIASDQVEYSIDSKRYLTVTGIGDYDITAIVVKGGASYHTYSVSDLGELPWTRLHAPQNESGKPAEISHWFLCGTRGAPSSSAVTTTTTPSVTTTTTSGSATATSSGSTTTTTTSGSTASTSTGASTPDTTWTTTPATKVTTTTIPAAAAGAGKDDLASTGFGSMWLLILGGGLVALGIAFVASPKLRGLLRR